MSALGGPGGRLGWPRAVVHCGPAGSGQDWGVRGQGHAFHNIHE